MKNFIAHTDEIRQEMLNAVSCTAIEDLFEQIPGKIKELSMQNPLSEL